MSSVQVRPIHDEIYPPATHDDDEDSTASSSEALPVVRYIHLQEVPDQYSVGIFVFPPYAKIPLHDHPDMCVLSRILYGDLERRSLDLPPPAIDDKDASTVIGQKRRAYYRAQKPPRGFNYDRSSSSCSSYDAATASVAATTPPIPVDRLVAPHCTVLYPREGNLHEFVAGPNGAAVLDVLLPPYDADGHRDCTFYEIEYCDDDDVTPSSTFLGNGDSVTASRTHDSVFYPCWIVPTGQPENFHCISGQYRDLGG
jgi:PCO_ADO